MGSISDLEKSFVKSKDQKVMGTISQKRQCIDQDRGMQLPLIRFRIT